VAKEFITALMTSGYEWLTHHLDFVSKSELSRRSGTAHTHRRLCEATTYLQCIDQYNMFNSSGIEYLVRYIVQIETAVKRNPLNPDFSEMDALLSSSIGESGEICVPKFQH
jgi:hypothetical protein